MARKEQFYTIEEIRKKFEKDRYSSLRHYLKDPKPASIKEKILSILKSGHDEEFEKTLRVYLKLSLDGDENLIKEAKKDAENYKPIVTLLFGKNKTDEVKKGGLIDLASYVVELKKTTKTSSNKEYKNEIKDENNKEPKTLFVIAIVAVVGIVVALILSIQKEVPIITKQPQNTTSHNNVSIENLIVSLSDQVFPDENTSFFNEEGKPKLWYASNNGQFEFYNKQGKHYQTKQTLKPVSIEVIKDYEKQLYTKPSVDKEDSNILDKGISFNTSLHNTPTKEELSLFVFDSLTNIDNFVQNKLAQELKKKYTITSPIISSSNLTKEIKDNLQSTNLGYFGNSLNNYTDYLCVGLATYSYTNSKINDNIICHLMLDYTIVSTKTGEIIKTDLLEINARGATKTNAKQNTIKKIHL